MEHRGNLAQSRPSVEDRHSRPRPDRLPEHPAVVIPALISLIPTLLGRASVQPPLDSAEAAAIVRLAREVAESDRGRLWGRSIAGPLLIHDRISGVVFGSEADREGRLTKAGAVFRGRLPASINPANAAVRYDGRSWTMVLWPLPAGIAERRQLLAHELWHRIQDSIGLPLHSPANGHLDREEGRVWLRLEARALTRALELVGEERTAALVDALSFRVARTAADPVADSTEAALERNEGLAEYTGIRLSGRTTLDQHRVAAAALERMESAETVGRAFAYSTGPAYGLLLDQLRPAWRQALGTGASLPELAAGAIGFHPRVGGELSQAELRYRGPDIRAAESARAARREARRRELVAELFEGPVLILPLIKAQIGFDPGKVESLDSLGTVYGTLRLSDEWGVLDATAGRGLVGADWQSARVAVRSDFDPVSPTGPGWRLDLGPGWIVLPDSRPGLWRVAKKP
jgi:hypothetical protein